MGPLTHVALRVTDLREAERYYCSLFDLTPRFREAEVDGEWRTLPTGADWTDAIAAGVDLDLCYLAGDDLELALERADEVEETGRLSHVGLSVDGVELASLRDRLDEHACAVDGSSDRSLVFADRYGVTWEASVGYEARSTGERTGRWLRV
jgi:catechol 2,3-dioxygenase-like lactoylglutathione lyase family enzyme